MGRKMGKESRGKRGPKKKKEAIQRVTTFKPNGAESMQIAPEPAVVDLGPVVLPEPEQAVQVLRVLAELNDRTLQAHARLVESQAKTKQLRSKWEELAAEVQKKLRAATHGSELPLFDPIEREHDTQAMELAAATQDLTAGETSQPEGSGDAPSGETAPQTFQGPDSVF